MDVIGIIPARLGSSRLPGKVLADLNGHSLIWHVCKRAAEARLLDGLFVATDAHEVRDVVAECGIPVIMTSVDCRSGTDRLAETLPRLPGRFFLNIQGDEPMLDPGILDLIVERWRKTGEQMVTPVYRIREIQDLTNPGVVKVVRDRRGRALYFSRSPIPFVRDVPIGDWLEHSSFWGHVGVYGYERHVLAAFPHLPESPLEQKEKLEQLRFLEAGYSIGTVETSYHPIAVDTQEDLERVRLLLNPQSLLLANGDAAAEPSHD
ncbi:MAG: 3-deoxy-manno-octulosonate cytidylyltransferase [Planctomycetes bacterium]|nr:3-deoxy-manno-octulosonate cytidylyltransferase [Planctomycetota bacterium]